VFLAPLALLALNLSVPSQEPTERPVHIVFVTGDEEYRSEESMPMLASILERDFGVRCTVLYAQDSAGFIAPNTLDNIPGLEALDDADLLVMFTRFRNLPDAQLKHITDYAFSGRPMVGFRTSTHAFLYDGESPNSMWNMRFGQYFFGQQWITHHGHKSTTEVTLNAQQKDHPILRGVEKFHAASWLYHVEGGGDALPEGRTIVAYGTAVNSAHGPEKAERFPLTQPVAWTHILGENQRVFFTTLGHPYDFKNESMRTLALNGILWALNAESFIGPAGSNPMVYPPFDPTDALYGGAVPGRRPQGLSQTWQPKQNARIAVVGNTMAERMSLFGGFEAMLHVQFPEKNISLRNLGWSADTLSMQPRPFKFGSMEEHLKQLEADTIFAFFGFNESFAGEEGLPQFRADLDAFIRRVRSRRLADGTYPEIILISPLPPENLGGRTRNPDELVKQMAPYVEAMESVARRAQVRFLDLFLAGSIAEVSEVTEEWNRGTINGIHLNSNGDMGLASSMMLRLTGDSPFPDERFIAVKNAVRKKSQQWWYRHRAINGYYIYGGRKDPFGSISFPGEMEQLDWLTAAWETKIHELANAANVENVPPFSFDGMPPATEILTNYEKDIQLLSPQEAEATLSLADGYSATIFASEVDFPELENPVAMTFDGRGRLWVSTMPTYPQVVPGEQPNCKILILEDIDGDGYADQSTVFADQLYLPAGFELGDGGAYVAQQPNLMFLKDEDGDDRADTREIVLHGFGTEDSHHALSAFTWGPGGGLYFQEGTFHHTQVETMYGPVRVKDGAVFRWEPHTGRLRVHAPFGFWNPWGHVFDDYGQDYIGDASDGSNYLAAPITTDKEYDRYRRGLASFTDNQVRPTGGSEIISSASWPDDVQGDYLVTNTIGFQGIRAFHLQADGSGVVSKQHWDLLSSSDPNFRPIDLQFGPDEALYFVDWFNPLIGHMQHSIRDPNRDHKHGRIWRVTHQDAATSAPVDLSSLPASQLLQSLSKHSSRTRYRARRELRKFSFAEMEQGFMATEAKHEAHALELAWVRQQHGMLEAEHLQKLFQSEDLRIRAAVVRMVNMEVDNPKLQALVVPLLNLASRDASAKVRLECVSLATRAPSLEAVEAVLFIQQAETDRWLDYAIEQAILFLKPQWLMALSAPWDYVDSNPPLAQSLLARVDTKTLLTLHPSEAVARTILLRPEVSAEQRRIALNNLGAGNGTTPDFAVQAWMETLQAADALDFGTDTGLGDLVLHLPAEALRHAMKDLSTLAMEAKHAEIRRAAMAAWMKALEEDAGLPEAPQQVPNALWSEAEKSPFALRDALKAAASLGSVGAETRVNFLGALLQNPTNWPGYPGDVTPTAARYIRISLPHPGPLTLAEVEVWSGERNIAHSGIASQDSEAWGGQANRAIDGNHHGGWASGSQTHTSEGGENPWWELDLGQESSIERVVLWNRTDEDLGKRLKNYTLALFDSERRLVWSREMQSAPAPMTEHLLAMDWRAMVVHGSLRAIDASQRTPMSPAFGQQVSAILEATPELERGQDWYQSGVRILERLGQNEAAKALRVHHLQLGTDPFAIADPLSVPPGARMRIQLDNSSDGWVGLALLPTTEVLQLADLTPEDEVLASPSLQRGQVLYQKHCLSCHAPNGGGLVGPNMADDYFLHLKRKEDIPDLIRDGLLEKGMTPFRDILTETEIAEVSEYMSLFRGTSPIPSKAAQGDLVDPWQSAASWLHGSGMTSAFTPQRIAPQQREDVSFLAPTKPGEYIFINALPRRLQIFGYLMIQE